MSFKYQPGGGEDRLQPGPGINDGAPRYRRSILSNGHNIVVVVAITLACSVFETDRLNAAELQAGTVFRDCPN